MTGSSATNPTTAEQASSFGRLRPDIRIAGTYGGSASTADVVEVEEVDVEALRGSVPTETPAKAPQESPKQAAKEAHSSAELLELVTGNVTDARCA